MITFHPRKELTATPTPPSSDLPLPTNDRGELFSILLPTWNNLPYLQLCVRSIQQNSRYPHQIIVHVNEGSDGTLQWVKEQGLDYTYSKSNVGICWAVNAAANLATTQFIVYMNDDMYVCPGWDNVYVDYISQLSHDHYFLSSTMIEPTATGNAAVIVCPDLGDSIETFDEAQLLRRHAEFSRANWSGATFPPNLVPKRLWDCVGGYSVEFSPGMASDPDFSMKLWQYGVRHFVGLGASRVYHFQCKSTGRVQRNDGRRQFMRKWRIAISTFRKLYLRYGKPSVAHLPEPDLPAHKIFWDHLRSRW